MKKPKYSYETALDRLMERCSTAEKCQGDIYTKMKEWGFEDAQCSLVIEQLVKLRFVDDRRFAAAYVKDKSRFNGWGEMKIRQMLVMKRVEREIISEAISEHLDKDLESEKCYALLEKKKTSVKYENNYQLRAKLFSYAASRGFEIDMINKHLDKLCQE